MAATRPAALTVGVSLYAGHEHYADHLWPIWLALPETARVAAWAPWGCSWWGTPPTPATGPHGRREPLMLAGFGDMAAPIARSRPLVYVEHGAGQAYGGLPPGWAGVRAVAHRLALVIVPGEQCAQRWRRLVGAPVVAVGCPKLDTWHIGARSMVHGPCVAVTFHWESAVAPETRSAWSHYDRALPELVDWCRRHDVELIGHGHPRIWPALERRWHALGIEPVPKFADVAARANVLVGDNTSALYEFASLGRPVVVLNAPWYRRGVEHGLRFWSAVPGPQADEPEQLVDVVAGVVADPAATAALREAAVAAAYAATDGHAAQRAAAAIMEACR